MRRIGLFYKLCITEFDREVSWKPSTIHDIFQLSFNQVFLFTFQFLSFLLYPSNNDNCTKSETQLRLFLPSSCICAYQLNDVTKPHYITISKCPLFLRTRAVLFTIICLQTKIFSVRNDFLFIWVFPDLINYSFACRVDPFGMNFLEVLLVDIILNWTESSFLSKLLSDCFP